MNNKALGIDTYLMKKFLLIFFLLVSANAIAQHKGKSTPVLQKGLYISFNPHSILEPEEGAVGLGFGYRISKRFEIWSEVNYLYKGFITSPDKFRNLQGFRDITSFKYYYNNKYGFFVGVEFRIKNYSFDARNNFINPQTSDTLLNYSYKTEQILIGGGAFWGKRFKLTANGKFEMEGNIGIGVKQRYIHRKNMPVGYERVVIRAVDVFRFSTEDEDQEPYFPAIFRFIYHL